MNKKAYIAPAMEAMNVETVEMIATSGTNSVGVSNDTTDDDAVMSNNYRGSWGNLWNKE